MLWQVSWLVVRVRRLPVFETVAWSAGTFGQTNSCGDSFRFARNSLLSLIAEQKQHMAPSGRKVRHFLRLSVLCDNRYLCAKF